MHTNGRLVWCWMLLAGGAVFASESGRHPNVVFILTDNHSAWTLGCYGNKDIRTPNIDRLAAQGVRFMNCFSSNAVCSPTRATYLTGLMPSQHGVHSYLGTGSLSGPRADYTLSEFRTLPGILHEAGYVCGLTGKWHLGDCLHPQDGFTTWVTKPGGHTDTFYDADVIENEAVHKEPAYLTDFWTRHAVRFIEENKDRPFFLYLPYNGPYGLGGWLNRPGRNRHVSHYADKELPCFPRESVHPWLRANRRFVGNLTAMRRYSVEISGVDDGVGAVMATLERLGLDEHTLVIFTADQGLAGGHNGMWGMADHGRPLHTFDAALHIPLIWRFPKRIRAGGTCDLLVSNYDFMPTLLSHLGLSDQMSKSPESPGRDYSGALQGRKIPWDNTIFYEYENSRMVRTDRWKLTRRFPDGPDELYDLGSDPGERANLFGKAEQAQVQRLLQQRLDEFFKRYADPKYDLWKGGISKAPRVIRREPTATRPAQSGPASSPSKTDARKSSPPGSPRVILETSFEEELKSETIQAPGHRITRNAARTGECSLVGEVTGPNQARTLEVPFKVKKGHALRVSYWLRSDRGSACTTFVRVGSDRSMIGDRTDRVPTDEWKQVVATYRPSADAGGAIQINVPSSWQGQVGKAWIDDLTVVETEDECQFSEHVMDFPAITCDGRGQAWMAVVERPAGRRLIGVYRIDGRRPKPVCTLEPENLTGIGTPTVAVMEKGCVAAFPAERNGVWRIAYAFLDDRSASTSPCTFIESKGAANISPAVAWLGSKACIVWESNAGNARGIYSCWVDRQGTSPVQRISAADANSYNPAIVALPDGSLFAAWDSARDKDVDIYGAWFRNGQWQAERRITSDARIERHPSLAVRQSEVWMAWQAQSYEVRSLNRVTEQRVVVARMDEQGLSAPRRLFDRVSTGERLLLRPRIAFDASGRLWLTARESIRQTAGWRPLAWCYSGDQWSDAQAIVDEPGRWRPVTLARTANGLIAACQFDNIPQTRGHEGIHSDWQSGVAISSLPEQRAAAVVPLEVEALKAPPTTFSVSEKMALCSAELPRQTIRRGEKTLQLFWGNLHEHTDLSICGRNMNPPGHDLFANVRDVERLDFCALTDHDFDFDRPQWAYNGEQTRNNNDPGRFITFLGEEWTSVKNPPAIPGNPNRYGHHNLLFLDPFHDHFYDSFDGDITPAELWKQLEGVEFICIPHQLADWLGKGKGNPPIDWNYVDEKAQPLAEIFQARQSYEYLGCPRQAPHGAPFKGYYLQDAWDKGIVIGTIASSDHGGGNGKAGVWAEALTRESLFEALRARHTFGTSGAKMGLFFAAADTMMGDKVRHPGKPVTFEVRAVALHDIKELVIFRNNQIVHREEPNARELDRKWTDPDFLLGGTLWYYTRIQATDGELAWSSPIWFTP